MNIQRKYEFEYRSNKPKRMNLKVIIPIMSLILVMVIVAGGLMVMSKKTNVLGIRKSSTDTAESEVDKLVNEIGKIMLLPSETPIVATVNDQTKTSEQKFFSQAQVGDKVLVFQGEKKAILYRPSDKRIIEVGYVKDEAEAKASESPFPTPAPLYNFNYSDNVEFVDETISTPAPTSSASPNP